MSGINGVDLDGTAPMSRAMISCLVGYQQWSVSHRKVEALSYAENGIYFLFRKSVLPKKEISMK
jgi:hypothetical protein